VDFDAYLIPVSNEENYKQRLRVVQRVWLPGNYEGKPAIWDQGL
jgi:hypothetical protein